MLVLYASIILPFQFQVLNPPGRAPPCTLTQMHASHMCDTRTAATSNIPSKTCMSCLPHIASHNIARHNTKSHHTTPHRPHRLQTPFITSRSNSSLCFMYDFMFASPSSGSIPPTCGYSLQGGAVGGGCSGWGSYYIIN